MNKTYKEEFIRAGRIAKDVRAFGKGLIKPGASYNAVIAQINQKIAELGARPAFPPQIALNEVAAHYLPQPDEDIIFSDQIVKLDVGISYNGAIGDCAVTVDLSGRHQVLLDAAEEALAAAEKIVKVGLPVREIGKVIEDVAASHGLSPIFNLSGHGLARYKVHTSPIIPNYDNQSTAVIKPGMTFAIEPFMTNGKGLIYEAGEPAIFSFASAKAVQSDIAKALLIKIKSFHGLPFAIHDLLDKDLTLAQIRKGLRELLKVGAIEGYAALIEEENGMVAQAENSVLVDEKGAVFITTR
ncbi:type II methionyl aminopeptidase [Candidatus Protochlamydia phocaeensis]|uniref:type II methionyl aminopeptidase n=1 Tax=Candidatus Protochlamydia phocaeensis TaxID=1414722 RepID=UPI000838C618|nr:type II methionyl aminopeptidase [Candidatus Protochlamydia phocaeensis]